MEKLPKCDFVAVVSKRETHEWFICGFTTVKVVHPGEGPHLLDDYHRWKEENHISLMQRMIEKAKTYEQTEKVKRLIKEAEREVLISQHRLSVNDDRTTTEDKVVWTVPIKCLPEERYVIDAAFRILSEINKTNGTNYTFRRS